MYSVHELSYDNKSMIVKYCLCIHDLLHDNIIDNQLYYLISPLLCDNKYDGLVLYVDM